MNNAVKFTVNYITAVKNRLQIEINEIGVPVFIPDRIGKAEIRKLKEDLTDIWSKEEDARISVKNLEGAFLQSAAYGLFEDFELCLKVGYLISDRIILWDYIFGRLLREKNIENIDYVKLGVIANNLVKVSSLSQKGNLVILPHPFDWHRESKLAFKEIAEKIPISTAIMGLVCSLAVAIELNVQPYTIISNEEEYNKIISESRNYFDTSENKNSKYYFKGLITALLSARLLSNIKFKEALRKPIQEFQEIVAERKDFYTQFRNQLSSGDIYESEQQLKILTNGLEKDILSWNSRIIKVADSYGSFGAVISGTLGLIASIEGNVSIGILSTVAGLSATLSSYLSKKRPDNNIITAVFSKILS